MESNAVEEPGCLAHPEYLAVATCVRCGKFICDQCVEDASLEDLPESGKCPECEQREPPPLRIGGWLWLAGFQVAFGAPAGAVMLILENIRFLRDDQLFLGPLMLRTVFCAGVFVLAIIASRAFLNRRRRAVPLMRAFYVMLFVNWFVIVGTERWMDAISGAQPWATLERQGKMNLVIPPALCLAWLAYFVWSKRVKRTFVVP